MYHYIFFHGWKSSRLIGVSSCVLINEISFGIIIIFFFIHIVFSIITEHDILKLNLIFKFSLILNNETF